MLSVGRSMKRSDSTGELGRDATWKVALKILRYLNENPQAADTANGILEWWLFKQSIREAQIVVEQALHLLEEQSLILCVQSADGHKHYCLNAGRITESRRLISEAEESQTQDRQPQEHEP